MATQYYYVPPQYLNPYISTDSAVVQVWSVDDDTVGILEDNGIRGEMDFSGSLTESTMVYITAFRTYLPGEIYPAGEITGLLKSNEETKRFLDEHLR